MRNQSFLLLIFLSFGYLVSADASPWTFELRMDEHAALVMDASESEGLIEPLFATSWSREGYLVSLVSSPPLALREPGGCDETYRCADEYLNVLYPETRLLPEVAGNILQEKWGGGRTFVDVPPETSPLGNYSVYGDFDVESDLDSIHLVLERAVFGGQDRGVVYVRCDSGCDAPEKWSNVNPIGPVMDNPPLNGIITLAKNFTTEGGLTFGRQRPDDADPMWYVTKFSK